MLLYAVVVSGIVLAIGTSIAVLTLNQYQLASVARGSEVAFHAAYSGAECIQYWDVSESNGNTFDVPSGGGTQSSAASVTCFGNTANNENGPARSGEEQRFTISWGTGALPLCSDFSVWKFQSGSSAIDMSSTGATTRSCRAGSECTVIRARGYNRACNELSAPRVIEREVTLVY